MIGGGGAGLAAAVSAAERGVSVVLVEAASELGGTTARSLGSFTAAGTRLQSRAGVSDSSDDFAHDMAAFATGSLDRDAPDLRAVLAAEAAPTLAWLEGMGVAFAGPFPEPPHRVPRMHNVVPNSRAYIRQLHREATRLHVRIHLAHRVVELIRAEDGGIAGAIIEGEDRRSILALRATILATGDFSANADMRSSWFTREQAAAAPVSPTSRGDGFTLADAVGAGVVNMKVVRGPQLRLPAPPRPPWTERVPLWAPLTRLAAWIVNRAPRFVLRRLAKHQLIAQMSPSHDLFTAGAILVNTDGKRFCDETVGTGSLSLERDGVGHVIFDGSIAAMFNRPPNFISTAPGVAYTYFDDYRRGRPDLVSTANSTAELARQLGLPAEALEGAVRSSPRGLSAPFHALGPVRSMLTTTEGALTVDRHARVLDRKGVPIRRLYAVGALGQGGMVLDE